MRGANPHATSMIGQSARSYASNDLIHQMLDQAAQARQLQDYGQSYAEVWNCLGFCPGCLHAALLLQSLQVDHKSSRQGLPEEAMINHW